MRAAITALLVCLAVMCASLWLTLPASAEMRAGTYTPKQLHDQSTVVFEGTVTRVETVAKYRKAFPVRAKVAAVLKGKLAGKDVTFRYKSPGKFVIREAEFNKPAVGQKGTFYLKDWGTLVLIGYIVKPAADQAAALKAAVEKLKSDRPAVILEGVKAIAAGKDAAAWSKLRTAMASEDVLKRLERPGLEGPMFKEARPLKVKFKILASAFRAIAEGPPARAIPALTWLVDQDVYVKTYTGDKGSKRWRAYLAYDALQYIKTATPDLLKFCARKLTQKDVTLKIRIVEALAAYGTPESIAMFEKYLWRYGAKPIVLIKHRDRYECTRLLLSLYRGATVEKYVHRSLRQFFAETYRTGSKSWPEEIKLPEIHPATKAEAEKFSKLFRGFLKDHGKIALTLEEIAAFQALISRCDRIAKPPASQPAGAAPGAEATVSASAKYARGNPLTIIVTLRNPQQKPLALWRPISVKASDLERFFRRHASCSLVRVQAGARDGKGRTEVPNRFRDKWSSEWGIKQVVGGGKSVWFTFDLREVFRLPADERGSYQFRITSVNPRFAASADFRIVDDPNVLQEKFVTWPSRSDREPEYTRRFCTVKTAAPGGPAYAVVLQEGGWANRTILRTAARPVALWPARLHENPVMTMGVQLLWLDEKAQLWLLPPYLLWKVDVPLQRCFKTTVKSAVDIKSVQLVANPPDWRPYKSIQTVAFDVGVALDDGSVTHRYMLYKRYTFSKIDQAQYAKLKQQAKEYRPPTKGELILRKARAAIKGGRLTPASGMLNHVIKTSPKSPEAREADKLLAEIRELLRQRENLKRIEAEAILKKIADAHKRGDRAGAEKMMRTFVRQYPDHRWTKYLQAQIDTMDTELAARRAMEQATIKATLRQARIAIKNGQLTPASGMLSHLIKTSPKSPEAKEAAKLLAELQRRRDAQGQ